MPDPSKAIAVLLACAGLSCAESKPAPCYFNEDELSHNAVDLDCRYLSPEDSTDA